MGWVSGLQKPLLLADYETPASQTSPSQNPTNSSHQCHKASLIGQPFASKVFPLILPLSHAPSSKYPSVLPPFSVARILALSVLWNPQEVPFHPRCIMSPTPLKTSFRSDSLLQGLPGSIVPGFDFDAWSALYSGTPTPDSIASHLQPPHSAPSPHSTVSALHHDTSSASLKASWHQFDPSLPVSSVDSLQCWMNQPLRSLSLGSKDIGATKNHPGQLRSNSQSLHHHPA